MEDFLRKFFSLSVKLKTQKLPGDGGHRSYTRIKDQEKSYILMSSGREDISLKHFISIQERLKNKCVNVPKLFHKDFKKGFLLMEDLGDETLETLFKKDKKGAFSLYIKVIDQMLKIQKEVQVLGKDVVFNRSFFMREIDFSIHHLECFLEQNEGEKNKLKKNNPFTLFKEEMDKVCAEIEKITYTYCHRDFHSKNIMIHNEKACLLDFQDGGYGPIVYDLTSLLYDSYISFDDIYRKKLLEYYFQQLPCLARKKIGSFSDLDFWTRLQFLQRGFKACGCFASFYNKNKKTTHLQYIKPTLKHLEQVAKDLNYLNIFSYISYINEYLAFLIRPLSGNNKNL